MIDKSHYLQSKYYLPFKNEPSFAPRRLNSECSWLSNTAYLEQYHV